MSAHQATTLLLTRSDVRRFLPLSDCVDAVEEAFTRNVEAQDPPPRILGMHVPDGGFHAKAAVLGQYFATKLNANSPLNPGRTGLPTIQGVVILADTRDGRLLAIMDSIEITILRTAAATALAARHLARPDAEIITVCGCGSQGVIQHYCSANRNGQTHDRWVGAGGLAESPIIPPGSEGGAFRKSRAHDLSGDSVIARPLPHNPRACVSVGKLNDRHGIPPWAWWVCQSAPSSRACPSSRASRALSCFGAVVATAGRDAPETSLTFAPA